jgi:hypothetical protein
MIRAKMNCSQAGLGIYPFTEGKLEDLEEVFAHFAEVYLINLGLLRASNN